MCVESIAQYSRDNNAGPAYVSSEDMPLSSLELLSKAGYSKFKCLDQEPYWAAGPYFIASVGTSSGPFGDGPLDKQTNSSRWRPLRPFVELHKSHAHRKRKSPSDYVVTGRGADKCSRADVHVRRDPG